MQRLGQSVLLGYLLAGVLLGGPGSTGVIDDIESFSFMGEVGIALLLFTVGLDLPIAKVRRFGRTALVAGARAGGHDHRHRRARARDGVRHQPDRPRS